MKATAIARITSTATEPNTAEIARPQLSIVPGSRESHQRPVPVHLTARQLEVLALLCEGLPNKLICRRLNISAGTVKAHISSILRELGVGSRLQAVVWARRRGLVSDLNVPDEPHEFNDDEQPVSRTSSMFRNRSLN